MSLHKSDSSEQSRAEMYLLRAFGEHEGLHLESKVLKLPNGSYVQVDGFSSEPQVACEVFAHLGALKDGQRKKLARDALKLLYVERKLGGTWRKVIVVADRPAERYLTGSSWLSGMLVDFGCEVERIELPSAMEEEVFAAQARQRMVNTDD